MMKKYMRFAYLGIFTVALVIFLISMFTFNKDIIMDFIFSKGEDAFMDFVNSIRDARNKEVYSVQGVIYPPLPNCIFWLLSKFYPKNLLNVAFTERYVLQFYWVSIVLYVIYLVSSFVLLFWITVLHEDKKNNRLFGIVIFLSFVFSMPMLWAVERGNTIIICVIFLIGFVKFRNDERMLFREMSYIFLGLATALKIYPALFIFLLLFDKNYKGFFKSFIYMLCLLMLPYLFYDGVNGVYYMLESIFTFSNVHSTGVVTGYCTSFYFFFEKLGFDLEGWSYNKVMLLTDLVYVFVMIMTRRKWMKAAMITFIIQNMSGSNIIYNALYFMLPLTMLLDEEKITSFELAGFLPMVLFIVPNPFELHETLAYSNLLWSNMLFPLMLIVLGIGFWDSCASIIDKNDKTIENSKKEEPAYDNTADVLVAEESIPHTDNNNENLGIVEDVPSNSTAEEDLK